MRDEVRYVQKLVIMLLNDRSGDDVDVQFFGEGTVRIKVFLILRTLCSEGWVIWSPAC